MTVRLQLASDARPRTCIRHPDRPATFTRVEERVKPIPSTYRIPECQECADRKRKATKEDGVLSSSVFRL